MSTFSSTVSLAPSPTTWMGAHSTKAGFAETGTSSSTGQASIFFQAILESMMQGVLIVNEQREIVEANHRGKALCSLLEDLENGTGCAYSRSQNSAPKSVWNVCQALLSSRQEFPEYQVIPEEAVEINDAMHLKIYAQWFDWEGSDAAYMLVTLEDRSEMLRNLARWDARRYGLTARETEVWMFKCQGFSYDEIADELYISRNTVKKHLKSISLKRENAMLQDTLN